MEVDGDSMNKLKSDIVNEMISISDSDNNNVDYNDDENNTETIVETTTGSAINSNPLFQILQQNNIASSTTEEGGDNLETYLKDECENEIRKYLNHKKSAKNW